MLSTPERIRVQPRRGPPSLVPDVLPLRGCQLCDHGRGPDHLRRVPRQHDLAAVVAAMHLRLHVLAGRVGAGVHVRDKADARHLAGSALGEEDVAQGL